VRCSSSYGQLILSLTYTDSRPLGPPELVTPLLSLSALSAPLLSTPTSSPNSLNSSDIDQFLQDLARRFEPDNEIDDVLGPVVKQLLFHESLFRPEGLGGGDSSWRGVVSGLEALVSIKSIAVMITRMPEWNPAHATAPTFELWSLLGPLCRLGVFPREWVRSLVYRMSSVNINGLSSLELHKRTFQTQRSVLGTT
jgi:ubiquitin conjugation factor E4 B